MEPSHVVLPKDGTYNFQSMASTASGNVATGSVQVNAPITIHSYYTTVQQRRSLEERRRQCKAALLVTLPDDDRNSTITSRNNLIQGTCEWIKKVPNFCSWLEDTTNLLWVTGSPGKGKTFLAIHLVDNLSKIASQSASDHAEPLILQYFCDNSDSQRNTALAVVRGVLCQLLNADEAMCDAILLAFEEAQQAGKNLFAEASEEKLWQLFENMVAKIQRRVYFVLDALDECDSDSIEFLKTELEYLSSSSRGNHSGKVKTVVIGRPSIGKFQMSDSQNRWCIDLDEDGGRGSEQDVKLFIRTRVNEIRGLNRQQQRALKRFLLDRAGGTFLWVRLATSILEKHPEQTLKILQSKSSADNWLPKGLDDMYNRMLLDIGESEAEAAAVVLHYVAMASRPLTRDELRHFVGEKTVLQIDNACKHLLTVTGPTVKLVHLSLKDHLIQVRLRNLSAFTTRFFSSSLLPMLKLLLSFNQLYLSDRVSSCLPMCVVVVLSLRRYVHRFSTFGAAALSLCYILLPTRRTLMAGVFGIDERRLHGEFARKCLELMGKGLQERKCKLEPGNLASNVDEKRIKRYCASHFQYACLYWVYHLGESGIRIRDGSRVHTFLKRHFLHLLEALSIIGCAPRIIDLLRTLQGLLEPAASTAIAKFLADADRFVQANTAIINEAPSQIYLSALAFTPDQSVIKNSFRDAIPSWLSLLPTVDSDWGACLQTLERHGDGVTSVSLSPDAILLVSGSLDHTIRIWDARTCEVIRTLKGHDGRVMSTGFSFDARFVVSGALDSTVKIWHTKTGTEFRTLRGHVRGVTSAAFSHDATLVVSGSLDHTIKIWDVKKGTNQLSLTSHKEPVICVAFSYDSKLIVSGSHDCTVKIYNLTRQRATVQTLIGHKGPINSVAFSYDAAFVVSGSDDHTIKIWRTIEGVKYRSLEGHDDAVTSVAFSPDAALILSGSHDRTIKIWDTKTGEVRALNGHNDGVTSVAFSPDNTLVVSGSHDRTVKIWDAKAGAKAWKLGKHRKWVNSVAFSYDSRLIVSGSNGCTIKIWDRITGNQVQQFKGHREPITSVVFSHDAKLVVSGSRDHTIKIWRVNSLIPPQTLRGHNGNVNSVAFSYDSKLVVSGSADHTIKVWNLTNSTDQTFSGHSGPVNSVAFSYDATQVVSGSDDYTIRIWYLTGNTRCVLRGHQNRVSSVAFSSDSKFVVSGSLDCTIKVWNLEKGAEVQSLDGHHSPIRSVAYSDDARFIVSGSYDCTVKIWDCMTGFEMRTLKGHNDPVNSVSFSHDTKLVVSGSDDCTINIWDAAIGIGLRTLNTVVFSFDARLAASGSHDSSLKIWNVLTGAEIRTLKGHSGSVNSVAFSHDAKLVVSGSSDCTIKLWNLVDIVEISTLHGHKDVVTSVAFSYDAKLIVSGSRDRAVKIWDIAKGTELRSLNGHNDGITSTAFSQDSVLVASGSLDHTIKIWNAVTGENFTTVTVGTVVDNISFDLKRRYIWTNVGPIGLVDQRRLSQQGGSDISDLFPAADGGYGISRNRQWITWNGKDVLWLPVDYRPVTSAVAPAEPPSGVRTELGTRIALGCSSGRVSFLGFSGIPDSADTSTTAVPPVRLIRPQ